MNTSNNAAELNMFILQMMAAGLGFFVSGVACCIAYHVVFNR